MAICKFNELKELREIRDKDDCIEAYTAPLRSSTASDTLVDVYFRMYKQNNDIKAIDEKARAEATRAVAELQAELAPLWTEIQQEGKEQHELKRKAESQADAIRQLIRIADERISFNEELVHYINSAKTEKEINEVREFLHKELKFKTSSIEDFLMQKRDYLEKIEAADLFVWKELKKILMLNIKDPDLFDHIFVAICANAEVLAGSKSAQKSDPNHEAYHFERMKKILKKFLSSDHFEFHRMYMDNERRDKHTRQVWLDITKRHMIFCRDRIKKFKAGLSEVDRAIFMSSDGEIFRFINEIEKQLDGIDLSEEKKKAIEVSKDAKNNVLAPSAVGQKGDLKSASDSSQHSKPKTVSSEPVKKKTVSTTPEMLYAHQLYGVEENFELIQQFRTAFFVLQKVLKDLNFIEKNFEIYRKEFNKTNVRICSVVLNIAVPELPVASNEGEMVSDKSQETTFELTEEEKHASEKQALEIKKFKEAQMERLKEWQKKCRWEKEQAEHLLEQRNLDLDQDPIEENEIVIEENNTELKPFEVAQLDYIVRKMDKNHLSTFEAIFAGEYVQINALENLLKAVSKGLMGDFSCFKFNGSSHFTAYIPNTRKKWEEVRDQNKEPYVITTQKEMSTIKGWSHSRESHNHGELQPRVVKKCVAGFTRAGITPERIKRALQLCGKLQDVKLKPKG